MKSDLLYLRREWPVFISGFSCDLGGVRGVEVGVNVTLGGHHTCLLESEFSWRREAVPGGSEDTSDERGNKVHPPIIRAVGTWAVILGAKRTEVKSKTDSRVQGGSRHVSSARNADVYCHTNAKAEPAVVQNSLTGGGAQDDADKEESEQDFHKNGLA